ncbi:MAG: 3-methyl-2-oxobutanoate hydroxymethyltransferase [Dehalococcoidia bacterium]|nr:3-methyl-2-oxobutanoate hydroxymethyltransferase [Dehalococcoidia bacterium]
MQNSIHKLSVMKENGEPIAMVTAYDYTSARIIDDIGFDAILVGDSLSQVMLGNDTTIPLTMDEALHHTRSVVRGANNTHVVADMPFLSYNSTLDTAILNAGRFLKEAGAQSVKLEGGHHISETIKRLVSCGIPVMGHIGLTPQSINQIGGYKVQGKSKKQADRLIDEAIALENAGAYAVVLELIPTEVSKQITSKLKIPTIGIGAGIDCDGQIQVMHDILGLFEIFTPKHTKQYVNLANQMRNGLKEYLSEVKDKTFPNNSHSFSIQQDS